MRIFENILVITVLMWVVFLAFDGEVRASDAQPSTSETAEDTVYPVWKGEAELGFVLTGGNTRTQNINAKLMVENEWTRWLHRIRTEIIQSSDQGTTRAQRFAISGRTAFKITDFDSIFAKGKYKDDRFSGYDYRVSETIGYARRLFEGPPVLLETSLGVGGRHGRLNDGTQEDDVVFNGEGLLEYRLGPAAVLSENVSVESGEKGTVTESVTSLKSQLLNNFAMKLSFTFRHNTRVPMGVKKADFQTAVTLVYGF